MSLIVTTSSCLQKTRKLGTNFPSLTHIVTIKRLELHQEEKIINSMMMKVDAGVKVVPKLLKTNNDCFRDAESLKLKRKSSHQ
jgi:hypothetical protein